jgi:hypothetical protein
MWAKNPPTAIAAAVKPAPVAESLIKVARTTEPTLGA